MGTLSQAPTPLSTDVTTFGRQGTYAANAQELARVDATYGEALSELETALTDAEHFLRRVHGVRIRADGIKHVAGELFRNAHDAALEESHHTGTALTYGWVMFANEQTYTLAFDDQGAGFGDRSLKAILDEARERYPTQESQKRSSPLAQHLRGGAGYGLVKTSDNIARNQGYLGIERVNDRTVVWCSVPTTRLEERTRPRVR
jgi:hypothetical protein